MCGRPSTQKGPRQANTTEIKLVQTSEPLNLALNPALVVPIDRNVPHQLHEQRTKSCAWGASGQEEQEPRRVEADRQSGLQTSSSRGVQSDVLPLGREGSWSGGTTECGGGALQEQSATERPASPRPHQITKPHVSSAQKDSDARLRFALRGGKGRGGSAQQSPCSTTQPSPTELKTILTYCASPLQMGREVGTCSLF